MSTVTLSTTGQVVIPKEIRDALHWETGAELTLTAVSNGVLLKATQKNAANGLKICAVCCNTMGRLFRLRNCASQWITAPTGKKSEKRSR